MKQDYLKSLIHFLTTKQPQGGILSEYTPIDLIVRLLLASNSTGATTRNIPIKPIKLKFPKQRRTDTDIKPIFNRQGKIVGWLKDNVIFDTMNQHRAFIEDEEDVFTYDCQHIGTFEEGFFQDKRGDNIAFVKRAEEGPITSFIEMPSIEMPSMLPKLPEPPELPIPQFVPLASLGSFEWSSLSWEEFLSH